MAVMVTTAGHRAMSSSMSILREMFIGMVSKDSAARIENNYE